MQPRDIRQLRSQDRRREGGRLDTEVGERGSQAGPTWRGHLHGAVTAEAFPKGSPGRHGRAREESSLRNWTFAQATDHLNPSCHHAHPNGGKWAAAASTSICKALSALWLLVKAKCFWKPVHSAEDMGSRR